MNELRFTLLVEPKSMQHGARACIRRGKLHHYNDAQKVGYQNQIILEAKHHAPREPMEGALSLFYRFYLPRPRKPKTEHPIGKPDVGNIEKHVTDALTHCGFWKNDSQICYLGCFKAYTDLGTPPRIEVSIKPL